VFRLDLGEEMRIIADGRMWCSLACPLRVRKKFSWYRGVIADASPANGSNYVRVDRHSVVIHLEAISSIVLPN